MCQKCFIAAVVARGLTGAERPKVKGLEGCAFLRLWMEGATLSSKFEGVEAGPVRCQCQKCDWGAKQIGMSAGLHMT